jgi:dolichol-phosphate mannosyltransferase
MTLSVLTPAFNEEANLDVLYARISSAMSALGVEWEWVIVDDHSRDGTFAAIERLAAGDRRVRGLRLARNSGSHVAISCALQHAIGDAAVLLVADLQDPPEVVGAMLEKWREGNQVIWGVRRRHPGQRRDAGASGLYYWIVRSVVGLKELPEGTDFFLIDRAVIDAFCRCGERHVSVFALIAWLGFRQAQVPYEKQARVAGRSGWTLARKIKLLVDSVTAFSDLPVRLCTYSGLGLVLAGIVGGAIAATQGAWTDAWLVVIAAVVLTGVQLVALGVIGEYVWRALDQARQRPVYVIERTAGAASAAGSPVNG